MPSIGICHLPCRAVQPAHPVTRFNRQWKRPALATTLSPAARAAAAVCGLAGSGSRLVLAAVRDWHGNQVGRNTPTVTE